MWELHSNLVVYVSRKAGSHEIDGRLEDIASRQRENQRNRIRVMPWCDATLNGPHLSKGDLQTRNSVGIDPIGELFPKFSPPLEGLCPE